MLYKRVILRKDKRPSNLFSKWMISYMSILIISLLICSFYYFHAYTVVKNETIVRQHLSLENVKSQLDGDLKNLMQVSTNLQMMQHVSSLSYKTASSTALPLLLHELHEDLSIFMVTNTFIKEIYIYFPASDYIVSSATIYKNRYSKFMPSRYVSEETWLYLSDNLHRNSYKFFLTDREEEKLLFAKSLITNSKTSIPLSIIIFEIDQESFISLLKSQLRSNNFSALILLNGASALLSTDSDLSEQIINIDTAQFNNNPGSSQQSVALYSEDRRKDYILDSVDLFLSDIKLVSLTEINMYNNVSSNMLVILVIALLTSILLGTVITYFFSVYNYRPIKEIMGYLKDSPTALDKENEYNKIKKMIIRSNSEIMTQRNLLKNNYLYKLLTGEIQLSQVSSTIAEQFHLEFSYDFSCVVLLRCSSFELHGEEGDTGSELQNQTNELAFFIAQNILTEIFEPIFQELHFCYSQTETAMIINVAEDIKDREADLYEGLNRFIEYCKNYFDIIYDVGVSGLCNNKHLSEAYVQAGNTLEYMHLFSLGNLCSYHDTPKEAQIGYLSLKNSDYVINLVMSACEQPLKDYFSNIYQELKQKKLSLEDAKSLLYFFYNVSMRLKAQLLYQYNYSLSESFFLLDNQFFNYSLQEAMRYIEKLYLQAIQLIKEQDLNSSDKKIHDVSQYIESNYFDINLNLNNIADHFHITPSYLSRKFRDEYGISMIDYLYKIRISHSLKLIKDTSLKIADIAQMVGFQDSNAFIRIFKKYQGCTPGKYKITSTE